MNVSRTVLDNIALPGGPLFDVTVPTNHILAFGDRAIQDPAC